VHQTHQVKEKGTKENKKEKVRNEEGRPLFSQLMIQNENENEKGSSKETDRKND